nr:very short patch repair endonuclease [Luteimonas sp. 9C]
MSAEKRSLLMSRIRGKDTMPEITIRRILWRDGFRYRLHTRALPGRPDLVLPGRRAAIFVHGCFWHAHRGCSYFRLPKTRPEFWEEKLRRNRERDKAATRDLVDAGWRVAIVWECAVRADAAAVGYLLGAWLRQTAQYLELGAVDHAVVGSSEAPNDHNPSY